MQLCLARTSRDAQHPGRLIMRVAIHGIQDENVSRSLWQPVYRRCQVPEFAGIAGFQGLRARIRDGLNPVLLTFRLSNPAQNRVDRNAMKPGCKRAVTAKLAQLVPGLDERLLRTVLSLADVSRHAKTKPVNLVYMQPIKGLKRARIRSLCLAYPGCFICDCVGFGGYHTPTIVAACHGQKRFQKPFLPLS